MRAQENKPSDAIRPSAVSSAPQEHGNDAGSFPVADNRPEAIAQRKFQQIANNSALSGGIHRYKMPGPVIEAGPPLPPVLPCGHRSDGGIVQRMIAEPPPSKPVIEALEKYVFGTPVNKRKQTFEQAATAEKYSAMLFAHLVNLLDQGEGERALAKINEIIEWVNGSETAAPHHPNPISRDKDKKHAVELATAQESPYTITKTAESIERANKARDVIMTSDIAKENPLLFMMGVLVLPDGKLIVALSGKRTELIGPLTRLLSEAKFPLWGDTMYDVQSISREDNRTYRSAAQTAVSSDATGYFAFDDDEKIVRTTVQERDDLGSYPAACAAAVALSVAKSVVPAAFAAGGRMGLTEVLVSTNRKSKVTIYNKETGQGEKFGLDARDVPSCHVCQMQLASVAQQVVALERTGIAQHLKGTMAKQSEAIEGMNKTLKDLAAQLEKEKHVQSQGEGVAKSLRELAAEQAELNDRSKTIQAGIRSLEKESNSITRQLDGVEMSIAASWKETGKIVAQQDALRTVQRQKRGIESAIAALQHTIQTLQADQATLSVTNTWTHAPLYTAWYAHFTTMQNRKDKTFSNSTKGTIEADLAQDLSRQQTKLQTELQNLGGVPSAHVQIEIDALQDKRGAEHRAREKFESEKRRLIPLKEDVEEKKGEKEKELEAVESRRAQLEQTIAQVTQELKKTERAGRAAESIEAKMGKLSMEITRASKELDRKRMSYDAYTS